MKHRTLVQYGVAFFLGFLVVGFYVYYSHKSYSVARYGWSANGVPVVVTNDCDARGKCKAFSVPEWFLDSLHKVNPNIPYFDARTR